MRRLALVAAAVISLAAPAAPANAAPVPKTTVSDVEDEVMCPICGTLLELSDSPQARRQKVYVARLVAEGRTKAEIKDALVGQYGPAALALPEATGFDLSAYLVPVVALLVAVCALAFAVIRWRRDGSRSPPPGGATALRGEEAERLEADLRRYDL